MLALFAPKQEDSYRKATQMLLTSKPSALVKSLADELCDCQKKLENCCAAKRTSKGDKKNSSGDSNREEIKCLTRRRSKRRPKQEPKFGIQVDSEE